MEKIMGYSNYYLSRGGRVVNRRDLAEALMFLACPYLYAS
jgi:hypothetical protein